MGVSELSSDLRDLTAAAESGNEKARLALEILAYRVKKYVGSYIAVLGGVDAIVFTGGIGENDAKLRKNVCSSLTYAPFFVHTGVLFLMQPRKNNRKIQHDQYKIIKKNKKTT